MTFTFKVGDICIGQGHVIHTWLNGVECEVIEPLAVRGNIPGIGPCLQYSVRWSDGLETNTRPHLLRKKQPPRSAKAIMREAILKAKHPCEVTA